MIMMTDNEIRLEAELTVDQLLRLGQVLRIETWPVVLAAIPTKDSAAENGAAMHAAHEQLTRIGLLGYDGGCVEWLADALGILSRAERVYEIRIYGSDGMRRACLAQRGDAQVMATRFGEHLRVQSTARPGDSDAASGIAALFAPQPVPKFGAVSAPTVELSERLADCQSAADYAEALHAVGAAERDVATLATALQQCVGHAEIVAIEHGDGIAVQSPAAVAVYETGRGRVVASPSRSPNGQIWTTITPGTDHRLRQAIGLLAETLDDGP